ncbi:MAG: phosphate acyltransferase PlsX, partial [Pseudomonadota bacterium]
PPASGPQATVLAIDAMGGDAGPEAVIDGAAMAAQDGVDVDFLVFGKKSILEPLVAAHSTLAGATIVDVENVVAMTDKPAHVLRRGRDTSMWAAVDAVKSGDASAVMSCGNTGALMAVAYKQLGMIKGVDRPAISALWPTPRGRTVVLDVGATVEVEAEQLVQFAIMGEAFFRAMTGVEKPTVGLLNVGAEELKGHELIRTAARILKEADPEMAFSGFVEGDDISKGTVDVVVTDGFSGNIALKSAEGAARLVGKWVKEALTGSTLAKVGALFMASDLKKLKDRIDPSNANGGVFLGLNGTVVKSHGGADAKGVMSAISMAASLARKPFQDEVSTTVARVFARAGNSLHAAE